MKIAERFPEVVPLNRHLQYSLTPARAAPRYVVRGARDRVSRPGVHPPPPPLRRLPALLPAHCRQTKRSDVFQKKLIQRFPRSYCCNLPAGSAAAALRIARVRARRDNKPSLHPTGARHIQLPASPTAPPPLLRVQFNSTVLNRLFVMLTQPAAPIWPPSARSARRVSPVSAPNSRSFLARSPARALSSLSSPLSPLVSSLASSSALPHPTVLERNRSLARGAHCTPPRSSELGQHSATRDLHRGAPIGLLRHPPGGGHEGGTRCATVPHLRPHLPPARAVWPT